MVSIQAVLRALVGFDSRSKRLRGASRSRSLPLFAVFPLLTFAVGAFADCSRIVSVAPSITETVFALELGDGLVGRTNYCAYPPQAQGVPIVGNFLVLQLEAIVAARPTLVLGLAEQNDIIRKLDGFGFRIELIDHRSLAGMKESIRKLGSLCGQDDRASVLLSKLNLRESEIVRNAPAAKGKKALVVVGKTVRNGVLVSAFVSGSDGYYKDLLEVLGARSVHQDLTVQMPSLPLEGLMKLDADLIIDVSDTSDGVSMSDAYAIWQRMLGPSSKTRVLVLDEDYASVPGPRYTQLLERIAKALS
jgi:iron complex transport system substrate-binding protein